MNITLQIDSLTKIIEAKDNWIALFKCWKKSPIISTWNPVSHKNILQKEDKIKAFPNKQKPRKSVVSKCALKWILKRGFWAKGKWS